MLSGKENKPPAELSMGKKQQHGLKAAVVSKPAAALGRSSKQLFLDLGQSDFSASKCAVCGMVYAKGHEEDEKLHRSFHSSAVQGLKFQGWAQERLVLMEPLAGRLLMLLPTDPPAHVKKVQEVCSFIEKWHGLSSGWLMAAPQCKVFLYVSLQKRVVGLAVVEPIKHAYKLAAPAGPVEQEVDSCQLTTSKQQPNEQQQQQQRQPSDPGAAAAAGGGSMDVDKPPSAAGHDMRPPPQQQQQQRSLLWAGLHRSSSKRSRLQALLPASANTQVHSTGKLQQVGAAAGGCASAATTSFTAGGSSAVKADSCPPSLLMAAELMQVGSASAAVAAAAQPEQQQQQQPEQQQLNQVQQPMQRQQQQQASQVAEQSQLLEVQERMPLQPLNVQQGVKQQQQQQQQAGIGPAAAGSNAPGAGSGSSKADGSGTGRAGSSQCGGGSIPSATPAAAAAGGGVSLSWGGRSGGGVAAGSGGSKPRSGAAGDAGGCMVADKRRAVRAMLGVRMVWVSSEQRRKGMATKLLDAARCNMVPGYVVPRSQLAFTQPSEEGARLAAAFTGTQQFMVYGIE